MSFFEQLGAMNTSLSFREIMDVGYFGFNFGLQDNFNITMLVVSGIICAIVSYLFGSINCSVMISSKKYGNDIRTQGSGNAGATNMMRVYGKKAATLTFLGDVLKSAAASIIGRLLLGYVGAYVAGLFCVIGHAFPLFFKFKGGKGVVAISTMCLLTEPLVFAIMLVIFAIILFGYKMVSLASIMAMITYPLVLSKAALFVDQPYGIHMILAAANAFFVVFLHRKNIARIFHHEESKISFGKKKKENEQKANEER